MRLTLIKLSGFKSFVDATQLQVPSQLVGVVGPNGCGKSNIIDAVRWVLGESKAAELRGESMQDVIFNGSVGRKAASRASVELVFDNSAGTMAGAWGRFAEIAVKRVLTRDGQSSYWINQQQVRRKDVYDLFLGTGLGPRAYAIIGQGMISRIVEARPDDLRVFLEEAAGVSKYKERRRETENRLADARDNLARVQDIRQELDQQVTHLEVQAEVAKRFQLLSEERDAKRNLMWAARRNEHQNEHDRLQAQIQKAHAEMDQILSLVRGAESDLEQLRQSYDDANRELHAQQGLLYGAVAETGRWEGEIRRIQDARQRLQRDVANAQAQIDQLLQRVEDLESELVHDEEALAMAEVRAGDAQVDLQNAHEALAPLQSQLRSEQERLASARAQLSEIERALALSAQQQRQADREAQQHEMRLERLQQERRGIEAPDPEQVVTVREAVAMAQEDLAMARETLAQVELDLADTEQTRQGQQIELERERDQLQRTRAQLEVLREVQAKAADDAVLQQWLEDNALAGKARLWERIRIDAGWETAVEAVLEERLSGIEVGRLSSATGLLARPSPQRLTLFCPREANAIESSAMARLPEILQPMAGGARVRLLAQCVHGSDPELVSLVRLWLQGFVCSDHLTEALTLLPHLPPGASLVLKEGHRLQAGSVRMYAADNPRAGVLARRQKIEDLEKALRAQDLIVDDLRRTVAQLDQRLLTQRASLQQQRKALETGQQQLTQLQLREAKMAEQLQAAQARSARLNDELAEVQAALQEIVVMREEAQIAFETLDLQLGERQQAFEDQQLALENRENALTLAREGLREAERRAQASAFEVRSLQERLQRARRDAQDLQTRLHAAQLILAGAHTEQTELDDGEAQAQLQTALEHRVALEASVSQLRQSVDELSQKLRSVDEARLSADRALQPLRDQVNTLQMAQAEARIQAEQMLAQLSEAGADLAELERQLAESSPKATQLQGEVTRLANAISALGAVNLAAMQELEAATERQTFLTTQSDDLDTAVATLEDAIRKIDRETRALMQETFDTVNANFGRLFPQLFGGGEARLVMTGDELLDAGVQVHAQPPGKRNSTIHLLSGGEKALTAIALVFAMFQLNPAPFCLLDEVDAPLDDPNTERFCKMVRLMSDQTQFLFISHNKIAMEMAQHLIGVTMQEQGVSRVVSVDLEAANEWVEEAA